jgi:predicted peroxiredoxin
MIRKTKQKSTASCTLPMYIGYLISESKTNTCKHLSSICNISHDSVNRFLSRENYDAKDLFEEAKNHLNLEYGNVSVDDTVLDKPYSQYMKLVDYFWSGKHHKAVKGINLLTMYYTDITGASGPINYRVVDKAENKTKNAYFKEMLEEVIEWGVKILFVTGDSWYSCAANLKLIKNNRLGFMFGIKNNRTVSIERGIKLQVKCIENIPENGMKIWLCDFGYVKIFRTNFKDEIRHYILWLPEDKHDLYEFNAFKEVHNSH